MIFDKIFHLLNQNHLLQYFVNFGWKFLFKNLRHFVWLNTIFGFTPLLLDIIRTIKPNIYAKGQDYKNKKNDISKNIYKEIEAIKSVGGKQYGFSLFFTAMSRMILFNAIMEFFTTDTPFKSYFAGFVCIPYLTDQ